MPMKNPAHPCHLLKDDIETLNLTVIEVADALGVTRQQLRRVMNGTSAITPEMAVRLERSLGTSADTWLRMQMSYDLAQVRLRVPAIKVKKLYPKVA